MMNPSSIPAGAWQSWVGPDLVAGRSISFSELRSQGETLYWLEGRPLESGRTVLVCATAGTAPVDLVAEEYDIGSRVHEYGGGGYCVSPGQRVVFSDRITNGVFLREPDGQIYPLRTSSGCRYAEFAFDAQERGVFCVREDHRSNDEPQAALVWLDERHEIVLQAGADFYAAPRPSADHTRLVWIDWSHPDMPWDKTRLVLSGLRWREGIPALTDILFFDDKRTPCSYVDPVWEDTSHFIVNCDSGGTWRPIRYDVGDPGHPQELPDPGGESGFPHWVFGQRSLQPLPDGSLLAQVITDGLACIRRLTGVVWSEFECGYAAQVPVPVGSGFAWIDTPPDAPPAIMRDGVKLREAFLFPDGIGPGDCAIPGSLSFPVGDGEMAHAIFYAPVSRMHQLAEGERPPLLVMAHGGPTGRASTAFSFKVQWWTSRGFAVLDVNYRGSTGFGRAYRRALEGAWGVADVEDCIAAVRYVLDAGLADPARCFIRGGSAGGLTVLMALARSDVFAAGTSLYGVTDLRALAEETHKFESRYLDRLIGPYPEQEALYLERSPLTHVADITAPVLFLHGDQDKVVPLAQAEAMYDALQARGRHARIHIYRNEGHGFRQQETLRDSFERELAFYQGCFVRSR